MVAPTTRAPWRSVAIPSEHGGWGLTLEPVLLGLAVAPSLAGLALGIAAFTAFVVRTPIKVAAVDRRRGRHLARTRLATRIAAGELALLIAVSATALALAGTRWLVPVAFAAPLVAVEVWFDWRSRSRRLAPELAGAVGIAAVAAAIALAGDEDLALAGALWLVLAGRSVASIPFVRTQVQRLHRLAAGDAGNTPSSRGSDLAQLGGMAVALAPVAVHQQVAAGAGAVIAVVAAHLVLARRHPAPVKILGITEMVFGLVVVAATAVGVAG